MNLPSEPLPWLLLGALVLTGAVVVVAPGGLRRLPRRWLVALPAVPGAVFLLRHASIGTAFLHQNGQGPYWVQLALGSRPEGAQYGPGYPEIFALAAWSSAPASEVGVFVAQSVLSAVAVGFFIGAARALGCQWWPTLALALLLAIDPAMIRLAHSESYFATGSSLLMIASGLLICSSARASLKSPRFWLGAGAAGLIVAQAVRVHPLIWPAAALVPLVAWLLPGSLRRRAGYFGAALAAIGGVIVMTSVGVLRDVLVGQLGDQWMPRAALRLDALFELRVLLLGLVAVLLSRRAPNARDSVLVFALALVAPGIVAVLQLPNDAIALAMARLYWPVLLPAAAAFVGRFSRTRLFRSLGGVRLSTPRRHTLLASAIALLAVGHAAWTWRSAMLLPTDVLEAKWATQWRARLPEGSSLVSVDRSGDRVLVLPVYDAASGVRVYGAEAPGPVARLGDYRGEVFYYRSSLCSSREGRSVCNALEDAARLELVAERVFPAIPSMKWFPYDSQQVRVALYRVR